MTDKIDTSTDLECTCDIGPFASCHACDQAALQRAKSYRPTKPKKRAYSARLDMPEDEYIALVRAGMHWGMK